MSIPSDARVLVLAAALSWCGCGNGVRQDLRAQTADASWPAYPDAAVQTDFDLDTLQHRTFRYFWELTDALGQVPDRWPTRNFSSIAATGFGLPALAVGVERGYVSREDAAARARKTLQFLWDAPQGEAASGVAGHRGLFYHFLNHEDGLRFGNTELSTIDTGLLMAGVLAAAGYFDGASDDEVAVRRLADELYRRVEWDFAYVPADGQLSMGWRPDEGFIPARWRGYNEATVLLVLALGSPTHAIPDSAWRVWTSTYDLDEFEGREQINFDPLFGHQYSQLFVDFRGIRDAYGDSVGFDYAENSRRATLSQRDYAIRNPDSWPGYGENQWGLTACDGPGGGDSVLVGGTYRKFKGYWARGVDAGKAKDDGTIAPTAAGGSVAFAPAECIAALDHLWSEYQPHLVGRYGFHDAFNLAAAPREDQPGAPGWFDVDYIGIDQGPILLQVENYRTGLVWNLLKQNPHVRRGLERAGFHGGWLDEPPTD